MLDDGWLDIAAIDTRGGIAGWAQLFGEVMLQGAGVRNDLPAKIGRIDHTRAQEVRRRGARAASTCRSTATSSGASPSCPRGSTTRRSSCGSLA